MPLAVSFIAPPVFHAIDNRNKTLQGRLLACSSQYLVSLQGTRQFGSACFSNTSAFGETLDGKHNAAVAARWNPTLDGFPARSQLLHPSVTDRNSSLPA